MRQDMKDLLVNTGRSGDYAKSRRARFKHADPELLPRRISQATFGWYARSQGDRLAPLRRFLEVNCGRPWADIYSEICAVSDARTIRGYHLREHVHQYVRQYEHDLGQRAWGSFFVGADGILHQESRLTNAERAARWKNSLQWDPKEKKWKLPKPPNPKVTDNADRWWEKIEGYWYEFTVTHIKTTYPVEWLIDRGNNVVDIGRELKERIFDKTIKRQVDSKTIKKLEAMLRSKVA
jgi:hypothetical protein